MLLTQEMCTGRTASISECSWNTVSWAFSSIFSLVYCFVTLRRIVKLARFHGDEQSANYADMFSSASSASWPPVLSWARTYFDFYFMIVAVYGNSQAGVP